LLLEPAGTLVALCGLTCFPIGNSCAQVNQASEILYHMSADMASPDSLIITGDGITDDRLDADFASIAGCLKTLGRGSSKIISDTPQLRRNSQS